MDSNPIFNAILWGIQILTAGVLLFHTSFNMLAAVRQKHSPPPSSEDGSLGRSAAESSVPTSDDSQEAGTENQQNEPGKQKSSKGE